MSCGGFYKNAPLLPEDKTKKVTNGLDERMQQSLSSHNMIREDSSEAGDLIPGTLEMLVLKALLRGPMHGFAVAEWIHHIATC